MTENVQLKLEVSNYIKQKMRGWLKLLKEDEEISISLKVDKEKQIIFEGDNKALEHILFKVMLRLFLLDQDDELL
ncbi:uncharacterized protein RHIMIDRAFT_239942 [Rhizopus microsporus ATCC 52813]|uniref:Uncharacterized protein n=1 Tax=Rhizopus microsporus ATCC 52813 TaxID=1340429 RepID=A0A2G4SNX3_RHIZD|nr:uncharacterized protein RHIMIDRAFT_239942 [Rhizopus microsporus ATCC 52813]PHZ10463.1 hypothetical protein RHIMIDRAFT_239942 [Rhizopus microsporus ATCC 52813]